MNDSSNKKNISETDVADYLTSHPDFFVERESLLLEMQLPHGDGKSVSLVERQVALLREKSNKTREMLDEFVNAANRNTEIFDKSRRLVLSLMDASEPEEFFDALEKGFRDDFDCSAYHLIVFSDTPHQINHFATTVSEMAAKDYIGGLLRAKQPTLGVLRQSEQDFLFRHQSSQVKSAAVLPVRKSRQIALLAVGSEDINYFQSGMGTIFISFIADTLAKLLPRFIYLKHQ